MAYEADRGDKEYEKARADANNANNVRNAADVAMKSGNPYAMAAGAGVKIADKVTGGKASEAIGKGMTKANQVLPGGKQVQNASNKLNESGASNAAGTAARLSNGANSGGGQSGSLPSSNGRKLETDKIDALEKNQQERLKNMHPYVGSSSGATDANSSSDSSNKKSSSPGEPGDKDKDDEKVPGGGLGKFAIKMIVRTVIMMFVPVIILILLVVVVVSLVTGLFTDYEDQFGISQTIGEETGNVEFQATTKDQQDFYDRVRDVKNDYQASGKEVDAQKIVSVYHVLKNNGANLTYDKMTTGKIEEFADAMLQDGVYNEDVFKENLINSIVPKYIKNTSSNERERIANEIIDYVNRYNNLVGKGSYGNGVNSCSSTGSCTYDIKGYYIQGKGNVSENKNVDNLYVRLMQCGSGNGHDYGGTYGQTLENDLVPFEKYILGVAYQEIGEAPEAAFKAQLVAARSFVLGRHVDMGDWRTLKQENGKWVIQIANCTQDQVYCDPDSGCSTPGDGQWSQVYSGTNHGKVLKPAMSADSKYRKYASEVAGEVLVNNQGYIIYTSYKQGEQNKFVSLANSGKNYKEILMAVYNQGSTNYGATDISRNSCSGGGSGCISTGDFATWKQVNAPWSNVKMGSSGSTISDIGCLVTSVSMLIAKSGVKTNISNFNPGTFVEFLNKNGGIDSGGNFSYAAATKAAPDFKFVNIERNLLGMSKAQKFNKIKSIISQEGVYAVCEVKGNTGQHWVAIDGITGSTINMLDPATSSTDMWATYNWQNTSSIAYYKVSK